VPQNWGDTISIISAMGCEGLRATTSVPGTVDGEVFEILVREVLCPAAAARTREALDEAISKAISSVSADNAQAWFLSCGYMPTNH
jgi:hypothetical protein